MDESGFLQPDPRPSRLISWPHVAKNMLMTDSSQRDPLPLTATERDALAQGPPRQTVATATRFAAPTGEGRAQHRQHAGRGRCESPMGVAAQLCESLCTDPFVV